MVETLFHCIQKGVHAATPWLAGTDTDGDGLEDGWEYDGGLDPLSAGGDNQFNPSNPLIELPNKTAGQDSWGWGIAQIDKRQYGDTTAEVYDWHENVASMNVTLREKRSEYSNFINMYRAVYANDASTRWFEPDGLTTNINGVVVSAEMWGILNCYNGKGGIPALPLGNGTDLQSPLKFDPVTTNWVFYTNANN